jgi:hypothetical protein
MKSVKTFFVFPLIGLCLIVFSCDFEAQEKERKCKQDHLDSLKVRYKYWTLAKNQKDSALIYYIEDTLIHVLNCKEFKEHSSFYISQIQSSIDLDSIDSLNTIFVDKLKAINRLRNKFE